MNYPGIIEKYGIGEERAIFFIAEVGTGHQGDFERVTKMVDICSRCGVSAIKFQHVIAKEILHPNCGIVELSSRKVDLFNYFEDVENKADKVFWQRVMNYCQQKNILFLCSFFGHRSFLDLRDMGVEAYKIASPEMNYYRLWEDLQGVGESVFFSSGVAKMEDLEHLTCYLDQNGFDKNRLVHLHCVTEYPATVESYDLMFTKWFENHFEILTGLSDHSDDPYILPLAFASLRANQGLPTVVEKHFTLDEAGVNIDDPVSINEYQLNELMEGLKCVYSHFRNKSKDSEEGGLMESLSANKISSKGLSAYLKKTMGELSKNGNKGNKGWRSIFAIGVDTWQAIIGNGKRDLTTSEMNDYPTTKRSLLAIKDIKPGEIISRENTAYLRSEKNLGVGLDYHWETKVIGLRVNRLIRNGEPVTEHDLS